MVGTPMRLEDALRFNGYTIVQTDVAGFDITVDTGVIKVPDMRLSSLAWQRAGDPEPSAAFYLDQLPLFDDAYRPVILSHILDRYSTRRLGYNMPDQFGLAVRRWANLNLGPMSTLNRMYLSTAVVLPLTTQDAQTTTTDHARDATSDFPQTQLGGNVDYASFATDRAAEQVKDEQGRVGRSVMELLAEQRAAYLNADLLVLDGMDSLYLGVWDRSERDPAPGSPVSALGFLPDRW